MNVLLTGGGTGGHVYPALAIAEALADQPAAAPLRLLYVGKRDGLEAEIVPPTGLPIAFVATAPVARRSAAQMMTAIAANAVGVVQALAVLHRFRPHVAVATGGYVAFPVMLAARIVRAIGLSRVRLALLEPNAKPGLTNRLLAPLVDEIWIAADGEPGAFGRKAVRTGTPLRAAFSRPMDRAAARAALGLAPEPTTVVVIGGSQGARSLNDATLRLLRAGGLPRGRQILLVCGRRDHGAVAAALAKIETRGRAHVIPYLDDPRAAYAAADLVVARSGAGTLAELAATGTPALLVPFPFATDGHQARNAESFARRGAARVIPDGELDGARLHREIDDALTVNVASTMRAAAETARVPNPAASIARRIVELGRG
ncbi:MAG: UDP-N-acetylglucosamine--N-acetylmuramyl-(pentapeptide) pyrophosphoryl-undecaprenol N-acetylglucosamine transferase [Vulcanimicrobiaceae bacterium]